MNQQDENTDIAIQLAIVVLIAMTFMVLILPDIPILVTITVCTLICLCFKLTRIALKVIAYATCFTIACAVGIVIRAYRNL